MNSLGMVPMVGLYVVVVGVGVVVGFLGFLVGLVGLNGLNGFVVFLPVHSSHNFFLPLIPY